MSERMEKIYEIAEDYYELRGRLFENRELLTEEEYKDFVKWFRESLKLEREELTIQMDIPHRQTMFENKVKHGALVPRNRFIFFPNRAKKLTQKELGAMLGETFQAREAAYNAKYAPIEETGEDEGNATESPENAAETAEHVAAAENPGTPPEAGQTETDLESSNSG